MKKTTVSFNYDKSSDVMYITFGSSKPAKTIPLTDSDLMRIDPETKKVIGFTIIDFNEKVNSCTSDGFKQK